MTTRLRHAFALGCVLALPLAAQDLEFTAVPKITIGLTNQGAVAGINSAGVLGAATQTALSGFVPRDVAVSNGNLYAVGTNAGRSWLIRLGGFADGTFALPQAVALSASPRALAVVDIDLDGRDDVVVAEGSPGFGDGKIEVFTGSFLQTGVITRFDHSDLADITPISTDSGNVPLSVTLERLNSDAFADIAYVSSSGSQLAQVEVIFTGPSGFIAPRAIETIALSTNGPQVDAIDAEVLNVGAAEGGTPDATPDIAVATNSGIAIIPTIPNGESPLNPGFGDPQFISTGAAALGVVLADVTRDNLVDIVAINTGSGNISTNVASQGGGYGGATRSIPVGANPISIALINFNNDGIPDIAVANAGSGFGIISTLAGNGAGLFSTVRITSTSTPAAVAAGAVRNDLTHDDLSIGTAAGVQFFANINGGYSVVRTKIFTAVSLASSIDRTGADNDVVVIEQAGGKVFVVHNIDSSEPAVVDVPFNDDLAFRAPTSVTTFVNPQSGFTDLAITDISRPGSDFNAGRVTLAANNGFGAFSNFRQFIVTNGATNILNGDFNNDSSHDLVYIDFRNNLADVGLNDGANNFQWIQSPTGGLTPVSARIGDINDDDRLDLVVAHRGVSIVSASTVTTMLGDGAGHLTISGTYIVPPFAMSLSGIVDFNNDGFPDFAVVSTRSSTIPNDVTPSITLFLNRPANPGNFIPKEPISLSSAAGQFRLDGSAGGAGQFSGTGNGFAFAGGSNIVSAADFNGDGSQDLVVSGMVQTPTADIRASDYFSFIDAISTLFGPYQYKISEVLDPSKDHGDPFIGNVIGKFDNDSSPDVLHLSVSGNIWLDLNNSAPVVVTPTIIWNVPDAITYGTALSATQLNATASTTGTFSYTPAAGTILPAGTHTLTVLFTPNDPTKYTTATKTVEITVEKATLTVTAEDKTIVMFDPLPTFTARFSGFVLGESTAVLSGSPAFATTATPSSKPGTYPIMVSQGTLSAANYRFVFVNGTLTIVGPQTVCQSALALVLSPRNPASFPADREKWEAIVQHLKIACSPALWIDATHLHPKDGDRFFVESKDAVIKLMDLRPESFQSIVDLLVKAARITAHVLIEESQDSAAIKKALEDLARGDALASKSQFHNAILEYRNAWKRF